jgi:hypothetical protein
LKYYLTPSPTQFSHHRRAALTTNSNGTQPAHKGKGWGGLDNLPMPMFTYFSKPFTKEFYRIYSMYVLWSSLFCPQLCDKTFENIFDHNNSLFISVLHRKFVGFIVNCLQNSSFKKYYHEILRYVFWFHSIDLKLLPFRARMRLLLKFRIVSKFKFSRLGVVSLLCDLI